MVDIDAEEVTAEIRVARQLSDLISIPDSDFLLATDEQTSRLVLLRQTDRSLGIVHHTQVPHTPVSVRVAPNGELCSVASLWARQLTLVRLERDERELQPEKAICRIDVTFDLPFAPRQQWWSPDGTRLLVADSFEGRIAAIDVDGRQMLGVTRIEGHNIRGMTATSDGTRLLVTHQIINRQEPTTHSRVFWGALMGNVLRSINIDHIWKRTATPNEESDITRWQIYPLGEPTDAAGDPGHVMHSGDTTVVLIGGTNQLAIRHGARQLFSRVRVGRRPVAMALSSDEQTVFVANYFDDSLSVVRLADGTVTSEISLGEMDGLTLADRGEMLFYDASLSLDRWYSCHSCHTDGHTSGQRNDNLGDGSFGAPKRILSLLGVRDTGPWAWSGQQKNLTDQIRKSIRVTMQGAEQNRDTEENVTALASYLYSLDPPPPLSAARGTIDQTALERGEQLFAATGCIDCHHTGTFTSPNTYDVGLRDEVGNDRFNPPSLRGVSQRGGLFHDGRGRGLKYVLADSEHSKDFGLSNPEIEDMVEYLNSL